MLNQAICEKCRHCQNTEAFWKKGWCVCDLCGTEQKFNLDDTGWSWNVKVVDARARGVPDNCIYKTEHVVSEPC